MVVTATATVDVATVIRNRPTPPIQLRAAEDQEEIMLAPNDDQNRPRRRVIVAIAAAVAGIALIGGFLLVTTGSDDESVPADAPTVGQRLQARQRVGVVPQQDNLDPDFDCVENLRVYARYFGLRPSAQTIERLLEFSGLTARATDRITTLSGGMQRRLTLARALVNDPDFIFLDEPSTGLDPQARHLIWERLRRLQSESKTLLLTTHFMEEAERLCDRVAVMDHGRIIATGTPAELVAECVERMVVEVYGSDIAAWLEAHDALMARHERLGQLAYCYTNDSDALIHALQQEGRKFACRPATLEDVFLRLTGRALRE